MPSSLLNNKVRVKVLLKQELYDCSVSDEEEIGNNITK
jgi:hypothetical protein